MLHEDDLASSCVFSGAESDSFHAAGVICHGLPAASYTSEAFWRLERERLFPPAWVFAGFAHELTKVGDAIPVWVAGRPLVLIRGKDDQIRAFHNVCRHRCLKLVGEPGNLGRFIRCPYHAWVYGLDGALRTMPYFAGHDSGAIPEGFDAKAHGLVQVRMAQWHDWVFVNLDAKAPPFEDFAASLIKRMAGVDLRKLKPVATIELGEVRANWKLLMENFIEPYHVQFVHKETTQQPLLAHETIVDGHCLGSRVNLASATGASTTGDAEALSVSSRYLTLFPNFALGFYEPDQIGVYENIPVAPNLTRQRRVIYSLGDRPGEAEVASLIKLWTKVHREDHAMCERLQEGRASPIADDGGVLSPYWEDSVRKFQELVEEAVFG